MKYKIFLLFILLILPTLVYADWLEDGSCEITTDCVISRQVIDLYTGFPISDAYCNITIRYDNYSIYEATQMINDSSGYYNHTINIKEINNFPSIMNCKYNNETDSANVSFSTSLGTRNYFYMFLILIPIGLFVIGRKIEELSLIMIGGFLLVIFGIGIFMGIFYGIPNNFISDSLSVLLIGNGIYFMGRSSIEYVGEL